MELGYPTKGMQKVSRLFDRKIELEKEIDVVTCPKEKGELQNALLFIEKEISKAFSSPACPMC